MVPGVKVEGGGRIKEDGPEDDPDTPVISSHRGCAYYQGIIA